MNKSGVCRLGKGKRLMVLLILLFSCQSAGNQADNKGPLNQPKESVKKERPIAVENGKFLVINGQRMLYGGEDTSHHFDISNCDLIDDQFHYGIGRETFPALIEPEFISVETADSIWPDSARFLVAYAGEEVKAYSIKDLTRHEVVNDSLNGQPIMAAYCILADLGAIYDRNYSGQVLTFALSGYTYYDPAVWNGLDGFVLWDRETESLWWPLVDKAISGALKDVKLVQMDTNQWDDVTWNTIKENYPNALVLKSGQDFLRPTEWTHSVDVSELKEKFLVKKDDTY